MTLQQLQIAVMPSTQRQAERCRQAKALASPFHNLKAYRSLHNMSTRTAVDSSASAAGNRMDQGVLDVLRIQQCAYIYDTIPLEK